MRRPLGVTSKTVFVEVLHVEARTKAHLSEYHTNDQVHVTKGERGEGAYISTKQIWPSESVPAESSSFFPFSVLVDTPVPRVLHWFSRLFL